MSEFTVTRILNAPRALVWQVLTRPRHFEGWLPAKSGTATLDVRSGGSWRATVVSADGEEIELTGRYDEVAEPVQSVITVPGERGHCHHADRAPYDTTQMAYAFDVDESMHAFVTPSVDEVLGRLSTSSPDPWLARSGQPRRADHFTGATIAVDGGHPCRSTPTSGGSGLGGAGAR